MKRKWQREERLRRWKRAMAISFGLAPLTAFQFILFPPGSLAHYSAALTTLFLLGAGCVALRKYFKEKA